MGKVKLIKGKGRMKPYPWKLRGRKIRGFFLIDVLTRVNGHFLWYNEWKDKWVESPREATSSGAELWYCWSVKALIRQIMKWNFPAGTIVRAVGKWKGEEWVFKVTS